MRLTLVIVECYAGSKAFERPRLIMIDGLAHEAVRATPLSVEEDVASRLRSHRFEVLIEDGRKLILVRQGDQWFLET